MVSNYALLALAVAVTQAARALPTPLREILLVCVCSGALLAGAIGQEAEKKRSRGPGPPPPEGWRWHSCRAGAPEVLAFGADATAAAEGGAAGGGEGPGEGEAAEALGVALVPGNPGIPHFYCAFGERLHGALLALDVGPATVYVVGYPNFATTEEGAALREAAGVATVEEEAAAISSTLAELRRRHAGRGLILLGHSLGAWVVTQHLLEEARSAPAGERLPRVPAAVLAMPFLEFGGGGKQRALALLLRLPGMGPLARCVGLAAVMLPRRAQASVAWLGVGWGSCKEQQEVAMATLLRQPHHVAGVALLARSELPRLDPARTPGAGLAELRPLLEAPGRPAILGLYTPGDMWAPEEQAPKLAALLAEAGGNGVAASEVLNLGAPEVGALVDGRPPPHEFVLSKEHLAPVAELLAARLAPLVSRRSGESGGAR